MEYVFVIALLLIAITLTLSYYYLSAKHSEKYAVLKTVEKGSWNYLAIIAPLAFDVYNKVGFAKGLLIAAGLLGICLLFRMFVVMCAKKLWRAE